MKTLNDYITEKLVLTSKSKIRKQQYNVLTDYKGDTDSLDNAIAFIWPKSKIELKIIYNKTFFRYFSCYVFY